MAKIGKTIKDVIRGDTRRVRCIFQDSDGSAINLSGGTVYFTVNSSEDPSSDSGAVIQKTATDADFSAPTSGIHTFTLTHSDTNITPGEYSYDCQFVDSAGSYLSAYRGKFIVQSDITRA